MDSTAYIQKWRNGESIVLCFMRMFTDYTEADGQKCPYSKMKHLKNRVCNTLPGSSDTRTLSTKRKDLIRRS